MVWLREATYSDVSKILEIERAVDLPTNPAVISPAELQMMMLAPRWQTQIVMANGQIAGVIISERRSSELMHLSDLSIDPSRHGEGLGFAALSAFLSTHRTGRIDLLTHPDNVGAQALYRKLGFKFDVLVPNAYDNGLPFQSHIWTA